MANFMSRETIVQGRQNQLDANETPISFTVENGAARTEDSGDLARTTRPARMAGEQGARVMDLMNNPAEYERTMRWMNLFGQSNQGAEWNLSRMNGGMLPPR